IVTNTRFFYTSVLGVRAGRHRKIPVLHIDHGSAFINLGNPLFTKCGEIFDKTIGSWVLNRADQVVGVSESVNRFLRTFGRSPDGTIYNGVEAASFRCVEQSLRRELGIDSSEIIVAFVGRLFEDKGILVLLDAMDRLDNKTFHLVIAGDGPLGELVRKRIS